MIIAIEHRDFLVFTQTDHARFAGELLSLWRDGDLADHPRRSDLLFAAREHDNGWREADAAPSCEAESGKPYDFISLPDGERRDTWRRGTARFADKRPYAALLITLHGLNVTAHRAAAAEEDRDEWTELVTELTERRNELLESAGCDLATAEADYRLIDLTDLISLTVCNHWADPFERHGLKGRFDPEIHALYLAPFPLAGSTTFDIPVRRIPRRQYEGDADLGGEIAAARWEELRVRVAPWAGVEMLEGAATEP